MNFVEKIVDSKFKKKVLQLLQKSITFKTKTKDLGLTPSFGLNSLSDNLEFRSKIEIR